MTHSLLTPRTPRARILLLAMVGAGFFSAPVVGAVTVTVKDGATTISCTLTDLSVGSGGAVLANVTSCNPALGGGGTGSGSGDTGTGSGDTGTGSGDTGTGGGDTGTGTGSGDTGSGSGTNGDPGTGLWKTTHSTSPLVYVADQSLNNGSPASISRLPGCINGGSIDNYASCKTSTSYSGVVNGAPVEVRLTEGQTLSIRFKPSGKAQEDYSGYLSLTNSGGSSIGVLTNVSVSTTPGDMNPPNAACKLQSAGAPMIRFGAKYCPVTELGKTHYFNIQPTVKCASCVWTLQESATLPIFLR